jgi:hypothetical protein
MLALKRSQITMPVELVLIPCQSEEKNCCSSKGFGSPVPVAEDGCPQIKIYFENAENIY